MVLLNKILNIIYRKQKFIEFIVILFVFIAISFRFGSNESNWLWSDYPFGAMILVIISLLLALLWVRIEKNKTQIIVNKITNASKNSSIIFNEKINMLTNRQREIFNLIIKGKSNKEIINELFIELSTLKTHINKIYKTLEISNRKEARAIGKIREMDKS